MRKSSQKFMSKVTIFIFFFLSPNLLISLSNGEIGPAAQYSPPYLPSECYGNDATKFPSSGMFAAAGEAIWENGAACGRQYLVRCISAEAPGRCVSGQTIQIRIVDRAATAVSKPSRAGATIALSDAAFESIADSSARSITVEFQPI